MRSDRTVDGSAKKVEQRCFGSVRHWFELLKCDKHFQHQLAPTPLVLAITSCMADVTSTGGFEEHMG